jgi:anti-anti-sigma regulatory factor
MAGIHLSRFIEGGRPILRILGTLDGTAARELLSHIQRERDIVVDVAFVRAFDEVGVAALARLVERSDGRRIALRGLSTHQLRILRYLGAGLSQVGAGGHP